MHFAIDGQTLSSPDADRGIGIYVQTLIKELPAIAPQHEWFLLDWSHDASIDKYIPDGLRKFYRILRISPQYGGDDATGHIPYRTMNAAVRAAIRTYKLDAILNPNPLQLHVQPVSSTPECALVAIIHDLTPIALKWPDYGFPNKDLAREYERRLEHVKRHASIILTDSDSTLNDVANYLQFPRERITTAYLGLDPTLVPPRDPELITEGLRPFGLENHIHNFWLSVGGFNPKKNLDRLTTALGLLDNTDTVRMPLVISGPMNRNDCAAITTMARKNCPRQPLIFTGYVSREVQAILYNAAAALLFPSLHEGFGFPALEAMGCACPVLGSNVSSVPEVIGPDGILVDPYDVNDIKRGIEQLMNDRALAANLRARGPKRAALFTYEKTIRTTVAALEEAATGIKDSAASITWQLLPTDRPKLLWFSPVPPDHGGVALYTAELVKTIAPVADVTLVTNHEPDKLPDALRGLPVVPFANADAVAEQSDLCVYNIMNNTKQSLNTYLQLMRRPGLTILHDINIHGFLLDSFVRQKFTPDTLATVFTPDPYTYALETAHDAAGREVARFVLDEHGLPDINAYPCHGTIVKHSKAVIAHSPWTVRELETNADKTPIFHLPLGMEAIDPPDPNVTRLIRQKYAIPDDAFLVVSGGYLEPSRRIDVLMRAVSRVCAKERNVCLLLAGNIEANHKRWLGEVAHEVGIPDPKHRVIFTGFLNTDAEFLACIGATDAVVHLRYPTNGETSATVLRTMSMGKPLIVTDIDTYHDLPDDCCAKVAVDDCECELIASYIDLFITRPDVGRKLAQNARAYVHVKHAWNVVGQHFMHIVAATLNNK